VVLGMGGYVSFPGGMMASALNRPLVIHEQNSIPGTSSRWLAQLADHVAESFGSSFPPARRAVVTGNPIRAVFRAVAAPEQRFAQRSGPLRLLVLGGSLGAQALNQALPRALALLPPARRPVVVHQSGEQHLQTVQATYAEAGVSARCVAFLDDVADELAAADLVVCRAGATTLAELAAVGIGAILVPFPFAIDDHQTRNARSFAHTGAAILLPQGQLTPPELAQRIEALDRAALLEMARKARTLAMPDAAERVSDLCAAAARGAN
jgi:UDP-N-acetylglucosamine--N-acetylmuramyl-(pentapeptide) pyrophosphoryl-undecaprenol N-acetylglucosamine transferase